MRKASIFVITLFALSLFALPGLSTGHNLLPVSAAQSSTPHVVQSVSPVAPFFAFNSSGLYWGTGSDSMKLNLPSVTIATVSSKCAIASSSSLSHNSTTYTYSFSGAVACSGLSMTESYKLYVDNVTNSNSKEIIISGTISKAGTGNISNILSLPLVLPSQYSVGQTYVNSSDNKASFSWADMQSFSPVWNSSTNSLVVSTASSSASIVNFVYDPTLVQDNSGGNSNGSITVAFNSNVVAGDVIIVAAIIADTVSTPSPSLSDTQTNSFTQAVTTSNSCMNQCYVYIYSATAKSSAADSVTWNSGQSSVYVGITIYEVSGISTSSPATSTGSGTGTSASVTSYSTTSGSFVAAVLITGSGVNTCTAGTSYTLSDSDNLDHICTEYRMSSSTSETSPMTISNSVNWLEASASFAPTITMPVKCTMNHAPKATLTLSGGSISPSTLLCDGSAHNFAVNPSVTITATEPAATSSLNYTFASLATTQSTTSSTTQWNITNYAGYNFTLKYSVSGGSPSGPTLTATRAGAAYTPSLTTSYKTYWLDNGTSWSVPNPLTANSTTRYISTNATGGTVTGAITERFYYYLQRNATLDYSVSSGNPAAPTLTATANSTSYTPTLTKTYKTYWLDNSTSWSIPHPNLFANANEKWNSSEVLSGTVSAAFTLTATYNLYYNVTLVASSSADGSTSPAGWNWYTLGASLNVAATANLGYVFSHWTSTNTSIIFANINLLSTFAFINGYGTIDANFVVLIVDLPVQCTAASPQPTITISGAGVVPQQFLCNGVTQNFNVTANSLVTLTNPAGNSTYRVLWPNGQISAATTTCVSTTCPTWQIKDYVQFHLAISYSVSSGTPISTDVPTFTYSLFGVQQQANLATSGASYWVDASPIVPLQIWFTNAQVFKPSPSSVTPTSAAPVNFAYGIQNTDVSGNGVAPSCKTEGTNVTSLWLAGCIVPAVFFSFANVLSPPATWGILVAAVGIPVQLKSKNMLLTFTTLLFLVGFISYATGEFPPMLSYILFLLGAGTMTATLVQMTKRGNE